MERLDYGKRIPDVNMVCGCKVALLAIKEVERGELIMYYRKSNAVKVKIESFVKNNFSLSRL